MHDNLHATDNLDLSQSYFSDGRDISSNLLKTVVFEMLASSFEINYIFQSYRGTRIVREWEREEEMGGEGERGVGRG